MFSPIKFFQPSYLFELQPYTYPQTIKTMLIFFGLLIIIGLALKAYKSFVQLEKFQDKLLERYFSLLITMGIIGVAMVWLRFERVNLLSGRFWLVVWAIALIVWLYPILKYQFQVAPKAKKLSEEKKLFRKYLPKKK